MTESHLLHGIHRLLAREAEIKLFYIETPEVAVRFTQKSAFTGKKFVALNGPQMDNNYAQEAMIISCSFGP